LGVLLLPFLTPVLMLSTIAPYEYAVSSYPDARVLVTTMFILAGGLVAWSAAVGRLLARALRGSERRAWFASGVAALLVLGLMIAPIRDVPAIAASVDVAREYARTWDKRDADLRRLGDPGEGPVATPSLRHMGGLAEIGHDPEEWINRCVAGTYGLRAVVAK
jgi:hypothetical protein